MPRIITVVAVLGLCAGCASSTPAPSLVAYPTKCQYEQQQAKYTTECQTWAKQQSGFDPAVATAKAAGIGVALGALGGAATGAAVGAATGHAGTGAAIGAVVGSVGGAAVGGGYGYTKSREGYDRAFGACMTGRGYSVR